MTLRRIRFILPAGPLPTHDFPLAKRFRSPGQLRACSRSSRAVVLADLLTTSQLSARDRAAIEALGNWAGADAGTVDPKSNLAAVNAFLEGLEASVAKLVIPHLPTAVRRVTMILSNLQRSTQPLVLEAIQRFLPELNGQGRLDFEGFLRSAYVLTPADAEPFLGPSEPRSVAAGCFLLRAVKYRLRSEAALRLEKLRPFLADAKAIAECEEALAILRK